MATATTGRPVAVLAGVILLLNGFAIAAIIFSTHLGDALPLLKPFIYVMMAMSYFMLAFLAIMAARGRNWARVACLGLVAIRAMIAISHVGTDPSGVRLGGAIRLIPVAIEVCGILLLFSPSANPWFKRRAERL
jgi:hypothetical protein